MFLNCCSCYRWHGTKSYPSVPKRLFKEQGNSKHLPLILICCFQNPVPVKITKEIWLHRSLNAIENPAYFHQFNGM